MRKIRRSCSLLLSLAAACQGAVIITAGDAAGATGDLILVPISITGVADLSAWQLDVRFSPLALFAVSTTEGPFLPTAGPTFFIPGVIDNVTGVITFNSGVLLGTGPGASGDGVLAYVQFTALASGQSAVSIENTILLDSSLNDLASGTQPGSVTLADAGGGTTTPEPASLRLLCLALTALFTHRRLRR